MVDNLEYVKRPEWQNHTAIQTSKTKKVIHGFKLNYYYYIKCLPSLYGFIFILDLIKCCFQVDLLEKHKRVFAERKRLLKQNSLVKISLEGNRIKEF